VKRRKQGITANPLEKEEEEEAMMCVKRVSSQQEFKGIEDVILNETDTLLLPQTSDTRLDKSHVSKEAQIPII
jgi:hypothetical protein